MKIFKLKNLFVLLFVFLFTLEQVFSAPSLGGLSKAASSAKAAAGSAKTAASGAVSSAQGAASGAMSAAQGAYSSAQGAVSGAVSSAQGAASGAMSAAQGAMSSAQGAAGDAVNSARGAISNIQGQVSSALSSARGSLAGAAGAVQGLMGGDTKSNLVVRLSQVDPSKFRKMKAYVSVEDELGNPVTGIDSNLFKFTVDDDDKMVKSVNVTEFRNTNEGIDYSILFSSSINLGSGLLNIQTQALINFLGQLSESDRVSIYTMEDTARPIIENVSKRDFDLAVLTTLSVSDVNPRLYDSISDLSMRVREKRAGRKAIIVISDEKDYQSKLNSQQFVARIEENGIPIYTIGIRAPSSNTATKLDDVSRRTNGKYYYCPMIRELQVVLDAVANNIINTYVVQFRVKAVGGIRGDNKKHTLGLSINVRESFGSSSKIFIAPKQIFPWWAKIIVLVVFLLIVAGIVFGVLFLRKAKRKRMGITNRRCPECGNLMKDSWDDCPFCKYLPDIKKKPKKEKKDKKSKKDK